MPAPPNDDVVNFTDLTGASGTIIASNADATVESGEPGGLTATIWYRWTCPASGAYYFTTRGNSGVTATNFASALRCYTSTVSLPAFLSFLEAVYFQNSKTGTKLFPLGYGEELGAMIAFQAIQGAVYFLQVGCRPNAESTGTFVLKWGTFNFARLGSCEEQPIDFESETCYAAQMEQGAYPQTLVLASTGPMPGMFKVKYVGGAWSAVGVYRDPDTGEVVYGPYYSANAGSIAWGGDYPNIVWGPNHSGLDNIDGSGFYASQGKAEQANLCQESPWFVNTGGDIAVICGGPDNPNGSNPTVQLIFNELLFSYLAPVGVGHSGSGTSWSFGFDLSNISATTWGPVTFTLLNTGGITNASAPVTTTIPANSSTMGDSIPNFTCNCDFTAGLVTASVQVSIGGAIVGVLTYPLYPVIAFTSLSYIGQYGGCGFNQDFYRLQWTTSGFPVINVTLAKVTFSVANKLYQPYVCSPVTEYDAYYSPAGFALKSGATGTIRIDWYNYVSGVRVPITYHTEVVTAP